MSSHPPKLAKNKCFYLYFQKTPVREPKKRFEGDKNHATVLLTFHSTGLAPKTMEKLT